MPHVMIVDAQDEGIDAAAYASTAMCRRRASLDALHPIRVRPLEYSPRTRAVLALLQIECVDVSALVKRNAKTLYRIDVYRKLPQHHIPVHDPKAAIVNRAPDLSVERSYSTFVKLRDEMFRLARCGHGLEMCPFCLSVIYYGAYGKARPRSSMPWMASADSVCSSLSTFMNDVLAMVCKVKAFGGQQCDGQERIPVIVQRFLGAGGSGTRSTSSDVL